MKKFLNMFVAPYRFLMAVFMVIIIDLFDVFDLAVRQLAKISNYWEAKSAAGCAIALLVKYNNSEYVSIVQAVFWLVILDIITKFFAISNQNLIDHGANPEYITTRDKFLGWFLAFKEGKIATAQMTDGFVTKMVCYAVMIGASTLIDSSLSVSGIALPLPVTTFCIGYILYSEFLSIVENLRDTGIPHMDKFAELLTTNIFNRLNR